MLRPYCRRNPSISTPFCASSRTRGARNSARIVDCSAGASVFPNSVANCVDPVFSHWPKLQTLWLTSPYVPRPSHATIPAAKAQSDLGGSMMNPTSVPAAKSVDWQQVKEWDERYVLHVLATKDEYESLAVESAEGC